MGVDKDPQPNYPFPFIQMDARIALASLLEYRGITDNKGRKWYLIDFLAIHSSPPCQKNSLMTKGLWKGRLARHPELIAPTRKLLIRTGKPYIIENVPTAPLILPVTLCGSSFGLKVRRHRLFESNFQIKQLECNHKAQGKVVGVYGHSGGSSKRDGLKFSGVQSWRDAMQIQWMTGLELAEAIPPAYTEYISSFIPRKK